MRARLRIWAGVAVALMVCLHSLGCVSSPPAIPSSVRAQDPSLVAPPYQVTPYQQASPYQGGAAGASGRENANSAAQPSVGSSLNERGENGAETLAPVVQKILAASSSPPAPANPPGLGQAAPGVAPPANMPRLDLPAPAAAPSQQGNAPRQGVARVEGPGTLPAPVAVACDLAYFVRLASENNPDIAAARTRIGTAKGKMLQAGLYPNPVIELRTDEAGLRQGPGGFLGVTFIQNFVRGGKLTLDKAAAGEFLTASDWQAVTRWFFVLTQVRTAYVEKLAADREVAVVKQIVTIAEKGLDAATKLREGGAGTAPDVLQAQVELDQSRLRLEVAKQRSEAASRVLAAVVGEPLRAEAALVDILDALPPPIDFNQFREALLTESCEVKEAAALAKQGEVLIRRAEAEVIPDFLMQVRPQYSFVDQQAAYTLIASSAIPVWNRNQGNIFAAKAEYSARLQDVRRVQNRLAERLALAQQRFLAAEKQASTFRNAILPRAEESLRLIRLGYERGDVKYDYVAVLNAQRTLAQSKLAEVQALSEMWKALAELAGLAQWETW